LSEVPASLRAEVVGHTHAEIIRRIKFFSDKDPSFLFSILPLLKPMKIYAKDTLYCQGDYAEEVFFIYQGRVKMYYDLNEKLEGKPILVPFNLYVEGSYFGDSDIFSAEGIKSVRDSTAISVFESQLLVITKKELLEIFHRFKDIKEEMKKVGEERKKHHSKSI
jgi:CRP-like cAMP-binding protein